MESKEKNHDVVVFGEWVWVKEPQPDQGLVCPPTHEDVVVEAAWKSSRREVHVMRKSIMNALLILEKAGPIMIQKTKAWIARGIDEDELNELTPVEEYVTYSLRCRCCEENWLIVKLSGEKFPDKFDMCPNGCLEDEYPWKGGNIVPYDKEAMEEEAMEEEELDELIGQ